MPVRGDSTHTAEGCPAPVPPCERRVPSRSVHQLERVRWTQVVEIAHGSMSDIRGRARRAVSQGDARARHRVANGNQRHRGLRPHGDVAFTCQRQPWQKAPRPRTTIKRARSMKQRERRRYVPLTAGPCMAPYFQWQKASFVADVSWRVVAESRVAASGRAAL